MLVLARVLVALERRLVDVRGELHKTAWRVCSNMVFTGADLAELEAALADLESSSRGWSRKVRELAAELLDEDAR